jgi:uncharacterized protein YlxW (UPF0749 family)
VFDSFSYTTYRRRRKLELEKLWNNHEKRMSELEDSVKKKVSNVVSRGLEMDKEISSNQGRVEKLRELITSYTLKCSGKQEDGEVKGATKGKRKTVHRRQKLKGLK